MTHTLDLDRLSPLPAAHAVDWEYRVMHALAGSAVPVPRAHLLCEDTSVIGPAFYLMEYVEGRTFWDPALPGMANAERAAIYDETNRVIAALHSVDAAAVGLADYGRPGAYLKRQIDRWTKPYRASATEHIEAMEQLIAWLPAHIPESWRRSGFPPKPSTSRPTAAAPAAGGAQDRWRRPGGARWCRPRVRRRRGGGTVTISRILNSTFGRSHLYLAV